MSNLQVIKKRVRNAQNVGKISKTMELVAAVKMRRAQEIALASRPYALAALDLFGRLSAGAATELPRLLRSRPVKKTLFLLVASDKGLAGSFNSALARAFERRIGQNPPSSDDRYAAVGQKTAAYLQHRHRAAAKIFPGTADYADVSQTRPISEYIITGYLAEEWDRVQVFSMHFRSALKQEPVVRELLPVSFENAKAAIRDIIPETGRFSDVAQSLNGSAAGPPVGAYLIEPSPMRVLKHVAERLLHAQVYHAVLESNAAEHAARRAAMSLASDNADDLQKSLTLQYNKARQAAITKEIIEISTGAEALA